MANKTLLSLLLPLCLLCPVNTMAQQPIKSNNWGQVEPERRHHVEMPEVIKPEPETVKPITEPVKPKPEPIKQKTESAKPKHTEDDTLLPAICIYVQPAFQVGSLMAVGASVGGYISNFNVEAFYMLGLATSEDIYWNKSGATSILCSYKPTAFGLRVGYGIKAMDALRLTPQVGVSAVSIKCSDGDSKGNATAATLGLRAEYALAPHFQVFAAPEVAFAVSKSDIYQQLMDVSSKIKSWASGFNVRLGLSVSF